MDRRRLLMLAPLGVTAAAGGAFFAMLMGMERGTFDPRGVPSQLIDKTVPPFALNGIEGAGIDGTGLAAADLAAGRPVLVNFFASWCVPCIEEAPVLMGLKRAGVPIYGIAYKDKPDAIRRFLAAQGNPYARLASDPPGRVAIDWGVTGVPETYLIDAHGVVRWRYADPLTPDVVSQGLDPMLRRYA